MCHSEAPVAIVLALEAVRSSRAGRWERSGERSARRLRPIQPEETAGAPHLILAINHQRVVNAGARKTVVPRWLAVVEVRPGVACQIESVIPQVHMQLIGLKGTSSRVAPRSHQCPRVLGAHAVIARSRSNCIWGFTFRRFRGCAANPKRSLIPRSRLKRAGTIQNTAS